MILIAAVRNEHMRVDIVERLLPKPLRLVLLTVLSLFSLFLLGLLLKGSLTLVQLTWGDYYIALDWLSVRYSFMALTVAGSLWFLVIAGRALGQLRQRGED